MKKYQYGLKYKGQYPTVKEKCGCVRVNMENHDHVIDYCVRHVLNEICQAVKGIDLNVDFSGLADELKKTEAH